MQVEQLKTKYYHLSCAHLFIQVAVKMSGVLGQKKTYFQDLALQNMDQTPPSTCSRDCRWQYRGETAAVMGTVRLEEGLEHLKLWCILLCTFCLLGDNDSNHLKLIYLCIYLFICILLSYLFIWDSKKINTIKKITVS